MHTLKQMNNISNIFLIFHIFSYMWAFMFIYTFHFLNFFFLSVESKLKYNERSDLQLIEMQMSWHFISISGKVLVIHKCKYRDIEICSTSQSTRRRSPDNTFLVLVAFLNFHSQHVPALLPPTGIWPHWWSYGVSLSEVLSHCLQQGSWWVRTSGQNGL